MPRAVKLRDYDYAKPKLDVAGEGEVLPRGQVEVVRFGERFFDPERASALARLRAQALRGKQEIQVAEGSVLGVRPGRVLEMVTGLCENHFNVPVSGARGGRSPAPTGGRPGGGHRWRSRVTPWHCRAPGPRAA